MDGVDGLFEHFNNPPLIHPFSTTLLSDEYFKTKLSPELDPLLQVPGGSSN